MAAAPHRVPLCTGEGGDSSLGRIPTPLEHGKSLPTTQPAGGGGGHKAPGFKKFGSRLQEWGRSEQGEVLFFFFFLNFDH